jgi:hypothetical protein
MLPHRAGTAWKGGRIATARLVPASGGGLRGRLRLLGLGVLEGAVGFPLRVLLRTANTLFAAGAGVLRGSHDRGALCSRFPGLDKRIANGGGLETTHPRLVIGLGPGALLGGFSDRCRGS